MVRKAKLSRTASYHKNIRITWRDVEVLLSIAQNQYLSTSQIFTKHFPSIERTRKRLYLLYQNKFINRIEIPFGIENLSSESVFFIDRLGLHTLRLHGKLHESVSIPKASLRLGNLLFLSHTLLRNSFRIALENAVSHEKQVLLHNWRHDNSITEYISQPDSATHTLKRIALKADAYFMIEKNAQELECYLEIDNGTIASDRIITKMSQYQKWHYLNNHLSKTRRDRRFLILLFSKKRARNIVNKLTSLTKMHFGSNQWLVAYINRTELTQTNVLTDILWKQPHPTDTQTFTLDQLLNASP